MAEQQQAHRRQVTGLEAEAGADGTLPTVDPHEYLRLTLDPTRLAVLGAAAVGPVDAAVLAEALGVPEKQVMSATARLLHAGLLTEDRTLDLAAVRAVGAALPPRDAAAAEVTSGPWSAEEADVLGRFFEGSRLTQIPMQQAKRRVVLERLAQDFEPGVRYPERRVNMILQLVHADYAALRRYLVDEGMLTRADGVYWRTGGRVDD